MVLALDADHAAKNARDAKAKYRLPLPIQCAEPLFHSSD
jgi:hypothetical protein